MKIKATDQKKDFVTGVRFNKEIYDEVLKQNGITAQNIVDDFIEKNVYADVNPKTKEVVFKLK